MKRVFLLFLVVLCCSCATQQKIVYLQDQSVGSEFETIQAGQIRFQPNDVISISVSSKNPELAAIFNKQRAQAGSASSSQTVLNYTIDDQGNVDFPILGDLHVAGLTRTQAEKEIKNRIIESGLIKDPVVTIDFINLSFSTIGEVGSPGSYNIQKEQLNIFEALSISGDLTIYGVRDRVFLTRNVDGKLITYNLDLRSADVYSSPAFYVQQNDVIYVEPSKIRTNQSTVNGNTVRSASFWMSLASFVTTIVVLIVN
ncbi:MAG: polysaccharide biosynthesis/export family protein [Rikenellaceae bacterium]